MEAFFQNSAEGEEATASWEAAASVEDFGSSTVEEEAKPFGFHSLIQGGKLIDEGFRSTF